MKGAPDAASQPSRGARRTARPHGGRRVLAGLLLCVVCSVPGVTRGESYTYDAANRLVEVLYDDGRSIRYEYDSRGNPTRILRGGRPFTLDVDDDGAAGALSDGLLVLRYLHGFSGPALVAGAAGVNAQNADAAGVAAFLAAALGGPLDVDGDGSDEAATDGRLVLRYLFGFRGAALVDAALGDDAQRDTATAVVDHLEALLP